MNEYFYLQFSSTEQIAHGFVQDAQNLSDVAQRMQRAVQGLYASGLQGAFVATFQSRMDSMQTMLRYFYEETDESGHDLLTVVQMARDLDATAARRFAEVGRYIWDGPVQDGALGGSGTPLYFAGGGMGGGGGGSWGYEPRDIKLGVFPNFRYPSQTDILREYLGGNLTFDQARKRMGVASPDPILSNLIDAKATLFQRDLFSDEARMFERIPLSGERYLGHIDVLSGEIDLGATIDSEIPTNLSDLVNKPIRTILSSQLNAKIEGEIGAYILHTQMSTKQSAQASGFFAAMDGYAGIRASGDVGIEANIQERDLLIEAEAEMLLGAEVSGTVGYENDFFSAELQGSVSYGLGAKGRFQAGFDDGVLTLDAGALVSGGVGGGGGLKVRVDVLEVGKYAVDQGTQGVEFLVGEIGETIAWVDSIM